MKFEQTSLPGVFAITPEVKGDSRGFFMEVFRKDIFFSAGLDLNFVQVNHSRSEGSILRGLHLQYDPPLGKLIRVIRGAAFFATVDCRKDSSTVGTWMSKELSAENKTLLYIPPGFASGFCVLGDEAEVEYQYTALYNPEGEVSIAWNDKDIGVEWPIEHPTLSARDTAAISFADWLHNPNA